MTPEIVADYECEIGENPMWHPLDKRVYWVDIPKGRLFRFDPADGSHEMCHEGPPIGGFTIQPDGSLLLFMAGGAIGVWRGGEVAAVVDEIPDERGGRFNDVIADPAGRVFCGTMPIGDRLGGLYRLDTDAGLTKVLDGIGCSNGMGFTPDRRGMYHTDSKTREIYLFDYDQGSGEITNRRVFATVDEGEAVPDGMTVDAEGYVWSARWGGGCVVRYAPDGGEDRRVELPARKVSSVTFGGDDYRDLYVTTAGGGEKETDGPGAGAMFCLRPGLQGVAEFFSRVRV